MPKQLSAKDITSYLESLRNEKQRKVLMRFFKTGKGEYGEGDEFLGLKVPQTREVVKVVWKDFPLEEVPQLLMNRWHEVRLCGFLILVAKFEQVATKKLTHDEAAIKKRDEILGLYLQYAEQANNWDLVDLSVHKILGAWLLLPSSLGERDYKIQVLDALAESDNLWKQRIDPDVPYTLRTNGIMVYPMANVQFTEANYQYRNHRLRFCALDLAQDWRKIDQRLRKIINFE